MKNFIDNFEIEKRNADLNYWSFVGLTTEIPNHGDFLTSKIFGVEYLIRNHHDEYRAFANVCPHRFKRLKTESCGNGPIVCSYHNLAFDKNGKCRTNKVYKLEEYQIKIVGIFIFCTAWTAEFKEYAELPWFSESLGNYIGSGEVFFKANWKIVVENTLEGNHIDSVHPKTFLPNGIGRDSKYSYDNKEQLSNMFLSFQDKPEYARTKELSDLISDRPSKIDGFRHIFRFPNLSIGTVMGLTFYIGKIIPIAKDKTIFKYYLFHTKTDKFKNHLKTFSKQVREFTHQTLLEDAAICEQVQSGMESPTYQFVSEHFMEGEERIHWFRALASRLSTID